MRLFFIMALTSAIGFTIGYYGTLFLFSLVVN